MFGQITPNTKSNSNKFTYKPRDYSYELTAHLKDLTLIFLILSCFGIYLMISQILITY